MRSLPFRFLTDHPCAPAWRTAAVVLLIPVILVAGLIAVVALTAVTLSRYAAPRILPSKTASALSLVVRQEPTSSESSLAVAARRAA